MDKGCRRQAAKHDGPAPWLPSPIDLSSTASTTIPASRAAPQARTFAASTTPSAQPRPHSPEPRPLAADDVAMSIALARRISNEAFDPCGPVVKAHRQSRQLGLSEEDLSNRVLCFHRTLTFHGALVPRMVALLCDVVTSEPCGRDRTLFDRHDPRLACRMLGRVQRAAIKLHPDDAVTRGPLISARREPGLACCRPVWALASVGAIAGVPGPHRIEAISIFAEFNYHAGHQGAAQACAKRWLPADEMTLAIAFAGDAADLSCELV
jgi:hypothetical protein